MKAYSFALTMGLGAAVGAVAVLMMPRQNPARRLADQAPPVWKMPSARAHLKSLSKACGSAPSNEAHSRSFGLGFSGFPCHCHSKN